MPATTFRGFGPHGWRNLAAKARAASRITAVRLSINEADLPDICKIAIALRKVDPVAHHKSVGYVETSPVGLEIYLSATGFIQQSNCTQFCRLARR